ncbi:MAG: radical SAM family heme chaperone HemW [Ruminiclostridium sp.]|nr:radical SAM family heme chaperone HemW [Ruminiclostridium sp.]
MTGLYIHVPFCLSKCPYCDFYSVGYDASLAEQYAAAVIRNLKHYNEAYDTVYFGGGTPVLLSDRIPEIMQNVRLQDNAEVTVEANPCVTDEKRLYELLSAGVNRISFGVQSLDADELKFLGRRHNAEQAKTAIELAYKAGFKNISADLMLGLPRQNTKTVKKSIAELSQLPINHISAYLLKVEENTPFGQMNIAVPEDEVMDEIYLFACEELEKNGFTQYEISNFAKSGAECKHNLKYWRCEEYVGIGAAAHSYYKGKRFCVDRNIHDFIFSDIQNTVVTDEAPGDFDEFAMLKLRLAEGLSFAQCERFGTDKNTILTRLERIPEKYYRLDEKGVSLTKEGFLLSNAVIGKILGY